MRRRRLRFSTELLLLQAAVVAAVVLVGFALFALLLDRQLSSEYGQRALAIARSFAPDDDLRTAVADWSATAAAGPATSAELAAGPVQIAAEAVRTRNDALFVVVTDDRGIRLAHPDPAELGLPVSTDPSTALGGGEEVVVQTGTLGDSARAKVPVYGPDGSATAGTVVGAVSVGIDTEEIAAALGEDLQVAALFTVAALALGVGASALLNRRLRRLTLGVEPEELAGMASEHEAVLGGIGEGVVAVDPAGTLTVANGEARRLFALDLVPGIPIARAGLPGRLTALLTGTTATGEPVLVVAGEKVLVCSVRTVRRNGRDLGLVLTARDRTDLELLTRQLDAVQTMSTALRAQRHEFANRLHVVHGLLAHGDRDEAQEYVRTLLGSGPLGTLLAGIDAVRDPTVQAFLSAKAAHARERSITLRLGPETWLDATITDPVAVTTVLGNLVDNACDAAALVPGCPPSDAGGWVEVELLADGTTLFVTVADSGDGVPAPLVDAIFTENVSTRGVGGRGLGLALVRQVARALDGDVWLADRGGDGTGAVFVARLPGVLAAPASPPGSNGSDDRRSPGTTLTEES
ncbi:Spo0B domain-containing protein [Nakamurella flavida]|uniref:histidine kinase n=1 Tax=Nakamurella flavida TaxID=363630 RepID=A0A938YHP6_9ACTN|nr:ATP-binding protein [Nakamurella flavida]MBM9477891.1 Spo0B domain-containing protein [Nakamurella flavida]MDP9778395.1 two-component system CitB family sensor kinase [Nakamurella flavida]